MQQFIEFVLKQDRPTAMNDALVVARRIGNDLETYTYMSRLRNYILADDKVNQIYML